MSSLKSQQTLAFAIIWLTYCITYFLRKPLGVVKPELGAEYHLSNSQLGWLDLSLLLPYATVQITCSSIWDKTKPRMIIATCLGISSVIMLLFCSSQWYLMVCFCLFINGAAQAPIWPACTKILSAWYPENRLSSVFGTISTAPYAGALLGTALAIYIQDWYHWRLAFVPAGVLGILVSILVQFQLRKPKEIGLEVPGKIEANSPNVIGNDSISDIWKITAVPEVSTAVFCLKFVRYCMYMWLPMYLIDHLGYEKAQGGVFSTMFDIGGILGGPLLGFYVDKYHSKRPLWGIYQITMLGTLSFILMAFIAQWGSLYVSILLLLAGAANCGPDALLTGSVTMLIGEKFAVGKGAGVTSLVNGLGSLGAILEGPVIGMVSQYFGWISVIFCMVGLCFVTTLATLKAHLVISREENNLTKKEPLLSEHV